jgi:hypothetical protein
MTSDDVLFKLGNKGFPNAILPYQKLTGAERIHIETEWTNYVQSLVDFGNNHVLSNFRYRLIMEDGD